MYLNQTAANLLYVLAALVPDFPITSPQYSLGIPGLRKLRPSVKVFNALLSYNTSTRENLSNAVYNLSFSLYD